MVIHRGESDEKQIVVADCVEQSVPLNNCRSLKKEREGKRLISFD
jgi:hypothetical protein